MSTSRTIRALTVAAWGDAPSLTTTTLPAPSQDQTQIRMLASGFPNLVRSQASGTHYLVSGAPLPYTPGIDGVGYTPDNTLVFINTLSANPAGGSFAEYVNVNNRAITPISLASNTSEPQQKELATKIAALINPAISSWMALKYRAHISDFESTKPESGWNVLILGATSTSGHLAALFARHLGASSIIGAARDAAALDSLKKRGVLDHTITLDKSDVSQTDFSILSSGEKGTFPHVVLDYIYGPTALALLNALPRSARSSEDLEVRYVHIGTLGRVPEIATPGPLLRAKNVAISGSGLGAWSVRALAKETSSVVKAIVEVVPEQGWREEYGVVERSLEDVKAAWEDKEARTVFVIES